MAFSESLWKWGTSVVGVLNIAAKKTSESPVRHEEILGSESSRPLCSSLWKGKALRSPGLGSQEHTLIHFFGWGRGHARVCSQIYLL